ncbi:MAG: NADH-quinone oxidoreductase subunit L, partial [Muribaculaceae bacterium]|nr:NADH-quinone oxidoreductase subunit L [Muribaculaceae bacterium]
VAILIAMKMYKTENELPAKMRNALPALWDWCYHRFYWDELYQFITHRIIFGLVCKPIAWFDRHIIDGTMDSFAAITNKASWSIRGLQSGNVQNYVWIYLIGVILLGTITAICLI